MATQKIFFFSEDIDYSFENNAHISEWVKKSIELENKQAGPINFIFCSDNYLLKLNQDYLNHNTYTDVITFNNVENDTISGDVFISIERVKENSETMKQAFLTELFRVIIHGVLHLIGYNDKTNEEAQEIRAKEDFYLTLLPKI